MSPKNNSFERKILDVPFHEKDEAKELGAWWDPELKKWYVPVGKDVALFERWFSQAEKKE